MLSMKLLITGHCGFIGKEAWHFFKNKGYEVYGIDNLSRNTSNYIEDERSFLLDINEINKTDKIPPVDFILHLAAQVSVVDSIKDPYADFNNNALGTFNIVQWAKKHKSKIIYSSTNKVFGDLAGINSPIPDNQPLQPKTNYGVSKCTGANYVSDYTVNNESYGWVLHQSCIYGESQLGDENQGWVGWIRQCIKNNKKITCFGTGSQVRDLLHVNDLIKLYNLIVENKIKPGCYVTGGGEKNQITFSEAVDILGGKINHFTDWRDNDQTYFVSKNEGLNQQGWYPEINFKHTISSLK